MNKTNEHESANAPAVGSGDLLGTGMKRQWEQCSPKAMSEMSSAAIQFAFEDAKSDIKKLKHALDLMTAGREENQEELKRCVRALDDIAKNYRWMKRDEMVIRAQDALLDIGYLQRDNPNKKDGDGFSA